MCPWTSPAGSLGRSCLLPPTTWPHPDPKWRPRPLVSAVLSAYRDASATENGAVGTANHDDRHRTAKCLTDLGTRYYVAWKQGCLSIGEHTSQSWFLPCWWGAFVTDRAGVAVKVRSPHRPGKNTPAGDTARQDRSNLRQRSCEVMRATLWVTIGSDSISLRVVVRARGGRPGPSVCTAGIQEVHGVQPNATRGSLSDHISCSGRGGRMRDSVGRTPFDP